MLWLAGSKFPALLEFRVGMCPAKPRKSGHANTSGSTLKVPRLKSHGRLGSWDRAVQESLQWPPW